MYVFKRMGAFKVIHVRRQGAVDLRSLKFPADGVIKEVPWRFLLFQDKTEELAPSSGDESGGCHEESDSA